MSLVVSICFRVKGQSLQIVESGKSSVTAVKVRRILLFFCVFSVILVRSGRGYMKCP